MDASALEAMGGGMWSRADCQAALDAALGDGNGACELLLAGFTAAAVAGGVGGPPPQWAFEDGPRGWVAYDAATQALLEAAYQRGDPSASFSFGRWTYDVNLQGPQLMQTNTSTGMVRNVQRSVGAAAPGLGAAPPPHHHHPHGGGGHRRGGGKGGRRRGGGGKGGRAAHGIAGGGGADAQALTGATNYDHNAEISELEMAAATKWRFLAHGEYNPAECDPITTEPFGGGPVVLLGCSGSMRGVQCAFRHDSVVDTLRASHGRCPACQTLYPTLQRGTQGSGTMRSQLIGAQCQGFEATVRAGLGWAGLCVGGRAALVGCACVMHLGPAGGRRRLPRTPGWREAVHYSAAIRSIAPQDLAACLEIGVLTSVHAPL
jgi:hypothetical protein